MTAYRDPPQQHVEDRMTCLEYETRNYERVHDRNIAKMNKTWLLARVAFACALLMLAVSIALIGCLS